MWDDKLLNTHDSLFFAFLNTLINLLFNQLYTI